MDAILETPTGARIALVNMEEGVINSLDNTTKTIVDEDYMNAISLMAADDSENIIRIKTDEIGDNPRQAEIYGDATPDKEFVASIADRGVLQPVIVAYSIHIEGADTTKPYCMISGHRRRNAAVLAGLRAIPAIVRSYENSAAAEMDFVVANFQREKTRKMRVEEYKRVKQILCQYSEALRTKKAYEGTVFDDLKLWTLSKELNIDPEKPFNMREKISEAVNLSEYEAKYFDWLYDANKLEKMFVELSVLGFSIEGAAAISTRIEELRGLFETEQISIKAAVDEIKQMFAEAKASMIPEKKKRGRPVAPPKKAEPEPEAAPEGLLGDVLENPKKLSTIHYQPPTGISILALHMSDGEGNPIARLYAQSEGVCREIRIEKLNELLRAELNNKMVD